MIYLEKKVAIFETMVYKKKENEAKEKLTTEKERLDKLLEEKRMELDQKEEDMIERRKSLAQRQGMEKLTSLKEKDRLELLSKEQALFEDLLAGIKEKLRDFQKTEAYIDLEAEKLQAILSEEEGTFSLLVLDKERDTLGRRLSDLGKELGMKVELATLDPKYLGGFILIKGDRTYLYDRTLRKDIEDRRYKFGAMLHKELKGQGEAE